MKLAERGFTVVEGVLIAVVVSVIAFAGWYVISANRNAQKDLEAASKSLTDSAPETDSTPQNTDSEADQNSSSQNDNSTSTQNVPFTISKVYFAEAPKKPVGAGFGECSIDQVVSYQAAAQVTARNKGTIKYHWEIADHLDGSINKQADETASFSSASTKTITTTLSYKVRDTGNGSNLFNRQYVNLMVTSPNIIYANIDKPVYAYKNNDPVFVWGTYIDLC